MQSFSKFFSTIDVFLRSSNPQTCHADEGSISTSSSTEDETQIVELLAEIPRSSG
jgi:hypothetical protein